MSRFKFNKSIGAIIRDSGINASTLDFALNESRNLMNDFVPMDTGELAESAVTAIESARKGSIVYNAPYARFLFYGERFDFSRDKNPKASAFWDRAMLRAYRGELHARIERFIRGG